MMRLPRSLRWRLQLWYGALLVAVLGGFGLTAFHLEKVRRFRQIDEELQVRLSTVVDALRAGPERGGDRQRPPEPRFSPVQAELFGAPQGYYYVIWMQGEKPITTSANAPTIAPKPASGDALVRMRGKLRESFLFAAPVNCVLVGRSIADEEADLRTFAAALAAVGGGVLAAGLIGGWWLVAHAIRPVEDISATAAKIATGDLSQRIATAGADSELGRLGSVLNATFARLETVFAQQARFTADAAHELRTPVSVILTQTQSALARERPAAEYRETLEACQRATQRMRGLIESLLALARLDAGQEPMKQAECDLAGIAADCLALLRPLADARSISLEATLSATPCLGDAERLAQVATNLLSNAIEYNHPGGQVQIVTEHRDGAARFSIRNTGPGIPDAELPHLFERFHRVDKSRTSGHSGLGLAISKAIVQAHGGQIEVASEPGQSATFTVVLPA